jgi:antitoxin PrlF
MQSNLTIKGQVTIPKAMRDHLGLKPGAPVRFAYTADGSVAILAATGPAKPARKTAGKFDKLKGINRQGWDRQGLKSTDEIMGWLRGYEEDARDPGLTPPAGQTKRTK